MTKFANVLECASKHASVLETGAIVVPVALAMCPVHSVLQVCRFLYIVNGINVCRL